MLNRSEILRSAWSIYREQSKFMRATSFSRVRFGQCLRLAWDDAKREAFYAEQEAEEAADALVVAAREELLDLNMKDRWDAADRARITQLQAIAA